MSALTPETKVENILDEKRKTNRIGILENPSLFSIRRLLIEKSLYFQIT